MMNRGLRFHLQLADGGRWGLMSSPGTSEWLGRFAKVLELAPGVEPGDRKLVFLHEEELGRMGHVEAIVPGANVEYPSAGWETRDIGMMKFGTHTEREDVVCLLREPDAWETEYMKMGESLLPVFHHAASTGGIPFHCALVEKDGQGILLGASGGIGKSTCARRIPAPWHALADDEALIVKTAPQTYVVHPFPTWSDYLWRRSERTWHVQNHVPLRAIFFLEQSETDLAIPVGQGQAAVTINHLAGQVCAFSWRELPARELYAFRLGFFHNASEISRSIPSFTLKVSLNGQFWTEIERVMGMTNDE